MLTSYCSWRQRYPVYLLIWDGGENSVLHYQTVWTPCLPLYTELILGRLPLNSYWMWVTLSASSAVLLLSTQIDWCLWNILCEWRVFLCGCVSRTCVWCSFIQFCSVCLFGEFRFVFVVISELITSEIDHIHLCWVVYTMNLPSSVTHIVALCFSGEPYHACVGTLWCVTIEPIKDIKIDCVDQGGGGGLYRRYRILHGSVARSLFLSSGRF